MVGRKEADRMRSGPLGEVYGLPAEVVPKVPSRNLWPSSFKAIGTSIAMAVGAFFAFGRRRDRIKQGEAGVAGNH